MQPTEPPTGDDRRRVAQERVAARARRISMLRRRVVAGALATFLLAWGVVSQTGSLGQTTTATAATPLTAAATNTAATDNSSTPATSTPVRTSQS
jgi:hypothetical protein